MARAARRHGKRGLKKGHKKDAKWRANISAGLRRAWRAGKFKNRRHGKRGHRKGKRRGRGPSGSKRYYHNIAKRFDESVRRKRNAKRKKRTKYWSPKGGWGKHA